MSKTKAQHTPGPWKYHTGFGSVQRHHIQTEGGFQIACTPECDEHTQANARLIAAAPELLAACYTVIDAIKNVRRAIAKATGQPTTPGLSQVHPFKGKTQ